MFPDNGKLFRNNGNLIAFWRASLDNDKLFIDNGELIAFQRATFS